MDRATLTPPRAVTLEELAMVEPSVAMGPELDARGHQAVAGPEWRPRDGSAGELPIELVDALLELLARRRAARSVSRPTRRSDCSRGRDAK